MALDSPPWSYLTGVCPLPALLGQRELLVGVLKLFRNFGTLFFAEKYGVLRRRIVVAGCRWQTTAMLAGIRKNFGSPKQVRWSEK